MVLRLKLKIIQNGKIKNINRSLMILTLVMMINLAMKNSGHKILKINRQPIMNSLILKFRNFMMNPRKKKIKMIPLMWKMN